MFRVGAMFSPGLEACGESESTTLLTSHIAEYFYGIGSFVWFSLDTCKS